MIDAVSGNFQVVNIARVFPPDVGYRQRIMFERVGHCPPFFSWPANLSYFKIGIRRKVHYLVQAQSKVVVQVVKQAVAKVETQRVIWCVLCGAGRIAPGRCPFA